MWVSGKRVLWEEASRGSRSLVLTVSCWQVQGRKNEEWVEMKQATGDHHHNHNKRIILYYIIMKDEVDGGKRRERKTRRMWDTGLLNNEPSFWREIPVRFCPEILLCCCCGCSRLFVLKDCLFRVWSRVCLYTSRLIFLSSKGMSREREKKKEFQTQKVSQCRYRLHHTALYGKC